MSNSLDHYAQNVMMDFCAFIIVVGDAVSWMLSGFGVVVSMNLESLSAYPLKPREHRVYRCSLPEKKGTASSL